MSSDPELDALLASVAKLQDYAYKSRSDQRQAERALRHTASVLQSTFDTQTEIWGSIMRDAALKTCLDVGVFAHMASSKAVWTLDELTTACGTISRDLLSCLLKHLASYHLLHEHAPSTYAATPYTLLLGGPDLSGAITTMFEAYIPTFAVAPALFANGSYTRPASSKQTMLADALGTTGHIFDWAKENPVLAEGFDRAMRAFAGIMGDWVEVVPIEEMLQGAAPEQVLVVDIAGGLGHDLHKLLRKMPTTRDRLVLQEQDYVLEKALPDLDGIVGMAHDFFTPNPVVGARAYFLHHIIHDWPDEHCRRIFKAIKSAMKPDSRILVADLVLPLQGATKHETTYDLIMMAMLGGKERNEAEWRALVESVGLRIVNIWKNDAAVDSVVEIAL